MRRKIAIESDELRSPLRGERLFQDVAGEPGFSERGGMARRSGGRGEIALLERELGAADQPRGLQALPRLVGALEPPVTPLEVAHLARGARGKQSGEAGRRARLEGLRRLLLGPCVAALVVSLQRRGQRGMRALAAATRAMRPNISRDGSRV